MQWQLLLELNAYSNGVLYFELVEPERDELNEMKFFEIVFNTRKVKYAPKISGVNTGCSDYARKNCKIDTPAY